MKPLRLLIVALGMSGAAVAANEEDVAPAQNVRIDVPLQARAVGGEYLLPADPVEDRRRSIRLSRNPVFATPVPRVNGTGLMLRNRLHAPVTVDIELGRVANAKLASTLAPRITLAPLESREVVLVQGVNLLSHVPDERFALDHAGAEHEDRLDTVHCHRSNLHHRQVKHPEEIVEGSNSGRHSTTAWARVTDP